MTISPYSSTLLQPQDIFGRSSPQGNFFAPEDLVKLLWSLGRNEPARFPLVEVFRKLSFRKSLLHLQPGMKLRFNGIKICNIQKHNDSRVESFDPRHSGSRDFFNIVTRNIFTSQSLLFGIKYFPNKLSAHFWDLKEPNRQILDFQTMAFTDFVIFWDNIVLDLGFLADLFLSERFWILTKTFNTKIQIHGELINILLKFFWHHRIFN